MPPGAPTGDRASEPGSGPPWDWLRIRSRGRQWPSRASSPDRAPNERRGVAELNASGRHLRRTLAAMLSLAVIAPPPASAEEPPPPTAATAAEAGEERVPARERAREERGH